MINNRFDINEKLDEAIRLHRSGELARAETLYKNILSVNPNHPESLHLLGIMAYQNGDLDKSANLIKAAIKEKSEDPIFKCSLGDLLRNQGRTNEALACYKHALILDPELFEAHFNMGNILQEMGNLDEAISCYRKAVALRPDFAEAYHNMGVAFQTLGRFDQAISHYERTLHLNPEKVEAYYNMGNALQDLGKFDQAVSAYGKALRLRPGYAEAYYNMGNAYRDLGWLKKAEPCYQKALQLRPDHAEAYNNMGLVLKDQNRLVESISCYKRAISLKPAFVEAHYNTGIALQLQGRFDEGLMHYKKALELDPEYSPAKWLNLLSLPILYRSKEDIFFYRNQFTKNLDTLIKQTKLDTPEQRKNALIGIGTTTNFYLQYQGQNDLFLQKKYGEFVCRVMAANYPQWTKRRKMPSLKRGEKIRVGYVSSFMYAHTVGQFLMGWIENSNRTEFDIYCYYINNQEDRLTERFKSDSDHFFQNFSDMEEIAHKIIADNLHVLVFTDIGMYAPATQLAGLRLAPVQCKGWGHPVTTGLPTIDYYLTSDLMEPADAEEHYSERLIRLPNIALAYKRPELPKCTKTREDFGIKDKAFVYLSLQSLFKYLPQHDHIYPRISMAVPNAQFVFVSNPSPQVTQQFKSRLALVFQKFKLDMKEYCIFLPRLSFNDFLNINLVSDVLLDTMSWSGGKSTLEAISCGLPVVTCPGEFMRGRHSYAMLKMIGLTETIARDEVDYIEIASRLGKDREWYFKMRQLIKDNQHKLYNDKTCVEALEDFYKRVVNNRPMPAKIQTGADSQIEDALRYHRSGQVKKDEAINKDILRAKPEQGEAYFNMGIGFQEKGNIEEAIQCYKKALQINPDYVEAYFNLADSLASQGDFEGAVENYGHAIQLRPDFIGAYNNVGNVFREQGKINAAIKSYEQVVRINPGLAEGYYNLGSVFRIRGDFQSAIDNLTEALRLKPDYAEAYNNLGLTLKDQGDLDGAINCISRAIKIKRELADAHWNLALTLLLNGNFEEGWKEFEWRFRQHKWRLIYPYRHEMARWEGSYSPDKTILVHDEQGLGDTFQFIRYIQMIKARCGKIIFETRGELIELLNGYPGIDNIVERSSNGKPPIICDFYVPLLSLPGIFETTLQTIPSKVPYLCASASKVRHWSKRVSSAGFRVGLVWAGGPMHPNDRNRSCSLRDFSSLLKIPEIDFYGLQKGQAAGQVDDLPGGMMIENLGNGFENFADTAGAIANLDLVISVDTSVAHLAGAMGKPVWVLLPFIPDWRWMMGREDSPWYPTMRLFRQKKQGDWPSLIRKVAEELSSPIFGQGAKALNLRHRILGD